MKQLLRYAFPLCSALLLSACGHDRGSRNYDVERYDLDAEYNWQKNCLNASVRIQLVPGEDGLPNIDLDSAVNVKAVRIDTYGDVDFEAQADNHLWVALDDITVTQGKPVVVVVDYEALPSDHLRPIGVRQGDPVDIRAIYTDSEPQGGRHWMPSHDDPADRAIFAAKLRMDARETAIANGKLMADETHGSSRYMRYETAYPLPTYLMAFAISEFEVHSTKQGNTPVEVWHRKGVRGDHDVMAAELARMIGELEGLLVPYPFERYALVLLPGHMVSGMENAGITFQRETSTNAATLSGDLQLTAHELAHQWFGDLMTVQTWDDVWIKEGMASLLEEEVFRRQLDASGAGTLNGHIFSVAEGDAIRDPEKAPNDKYDSGPYGRSAWFLTQIRRVVGEEAFWSTLRQLLESHRMGNVSSEDFVQAFAPAFEPLGADKLRRALAAKALPRIVFSEAEQTATLTDSDGALIAPIEYAWVSLDGSQHRKPLLRGELNHLQSASLDDLLVLDPDDVHPEWETFIEGGALPDFLGPRRLPTTPEQLDVFLGLSGTAQRMALQINSENPWPLEADKLGAFLKNLHTDGAQALGLERACEAALANPSPQWTDGIRTAFTTMPTPFGLSAIGTYTACAEVLGEPQPWDAQWQTLAGGLPNGELSAAQ
ncbi:MAG TPA: M1 family aminopeptidase, partial [Polyangium sp.]|nr:M1 family aminopeptidase [Polyangium sp.]